jgi:hypothetical protein
MTQLTREELTKKIILQSDETERLYRELNRLRDALEEVSIRANDKENDRAAIALLNEEAREGWGRASLASKQWQQAYNELLAESQTRISNATGGNFDVRTLEPREAAPVYCDHSQWREAERKLEEITALPILDYTAVYDLADDLKSILFPFIPEPELCDFEFGIHPHSCCLKRGHGGHHECGCGTTL